MSLLLDTFQEACQDLAFDKASGSRGKIEPPARFVLDELSNIEKWPGLRNAITQGGGNGYQLIIVEQSRQQMADEKDGYGKAVEQTVWENCHRIMLKGVSDDETLNGGSARSARTTIPAANPPGIRDRDHWAV